MISVKDRVPLYPGRVKLTPVAGQTNVHDMIRVDQPQQAGTALDRKTMQLLQADIRTYPVKAGETIKAGDVVDVVGGEIVHSSSGLPNKKTVLRNNAIKGNAVCSLDNDFIAVTDIYDNMIWEARTYKVNTDGTVKFVSSKLLANSTGAAYSHPEIITLSGTKFIVGEYSDPQYSSIAQVGTIDSNGMLTISGSNTTLVQGGSAGFKMVSLSGESFIGFYNKGGLKAKVFPVAGLNITTNTTTESFLPGSTNASYLSADRLPDINGNKRVCVCYSDAGDGNKGKAVIATIKLDNSVEWGTPVVFNASATNYIHCCTDGGDVVVTYQGVGNDKYANILAIQESKIFVKTPLNIGPMGSGSSRATPVEKIGNSIVVVRDLNKTGIALLLKRNVNDLQKCNEFMFDSGGFGYGNPAICTTPDKLLVGYPEAANSSYGTATLLEVRGDQIAGSFEDTSSQAIALQSGTGGQNIEVIFDGTAELPGIKKGTIITSPGVQGYCPQDGWLWVKPEWDFGAVSGAFITPASTGESNKIFVNLGFTPTILFITGAYSISTIFETRNWVLLRVSSNGSISTDSQLKVVAGGFEVYTTELSGCGVSVPYAALR